MNPAPKPIDETNYSGRFAARLRMLREKTGMTGQEAAEAVKKCGYSASVRSFYSWENGERQPPLDAFPAIAGALGVKRIRDLLPTE